MYAACVCNCVRYLVIVVVLMGLGGAKRYVCWEVLKASFVGFFMAEVDPSRHFS